MIKHIFHVLSEILFTVNGDRSHVGLQSLSFRQTFRALYWFYGAIVPPFTVTDSEIEIIPFLVSLEKHVVHYSRFLLRNFDMQIIIVIIWDPDQFSLCVCVKRHVFGHNPTNLGSHLPLRFLPLNYSQYTESYNNA